MHASMAVNSDAHDCTALSGDALKHCTNSLNSRVQEDVPNGFAIACKTTFAANTHRRQVSKIVADTGCTMNKYFATTIPNSSDGEDAQH